MFGAEQGRDDKVIARGEERPGIWRRALGRLAEIF
jgi:hypothetical protein